jgi:hypothetical protein
MNENGFDPPARARRRKPRRNFEDASLYVLRGEKRLLQLISTRAPLAKVLNEICSALDFQIGNVVSLFSLPGYDASELAAIAMNAALFGLHTFCSEDIVAEDGETLGFLEMYSGVLRCPSASEFELIERAKRLAAIAIKRDNGAGQPSSCGIHGSRPIRRRVLEWPVSTN